MDRPLLLPLVSCTQPSLVGGKAIGLARLLAGGFPVPSGLCVTTEAYSHALRVPGFSSVEQWQSALQSSGAALKEGDQISLDAERGEIIVLVRAGATA